MTLTFTLNGLPKTTNSGGRAHWTAKVREARTWHTLVKLALRAHMPKVPHKTAKLTLTRHSSSRPDYDGLVSSWKNVIDAIVQCGFLANDKHENIGVPTYLWEKAAPRQGRITLTIETKEKE